MMASRIKLLVRDDESLNAFGRRTGIDSASISMYTSAKTMPTLEALISIADATGVTLDWLALGTEPKFRRDMRSSVSIAAHGKHSIAAGGDVVVHQTKK